MATTGQIDLVKVTKRFGNLVAVDAIDLTIPAGTYCCLLGPSGCGKTTILRMIAGHEALTSGDVQIDGQSVVGLTPVARGTAMMFQSYALFPTSRCSTTSPSTSRCGASVRPSGAPRRAR